MSDRKSEATPRRDDGGRERRARGGGRARRRDERFVLYVEGPRDREILGSWARRVEPAIARCIEDRTVILGGRQPARALRDFRKRGGRKDGWRGLVVLDRDHHDDERGGETASADLGEEPGLEVFVWGLRHIESYLLVPSALRRMLGTVDGDERVDQAIAAELAASSVAEVDGPVHAKRILGAGGSLSEALGTDLRAGAIARAMRADELHDDVRRLLARIGSLSGVAGPAPEVVIRRG